MPNPARSIRAGALTAGLALAASLLAPLAQADETTAPSTPPSSPATSAPRTSTPTTSAGPPTSSLTPSSPPPSSSTSKQVAAEQPDLRISAQLLAEGDLVNGQEFQTKVVLTNAGKGIARSVRGNIRRPSSLSLSSLEWREFDPYGPGGTLAPGASVTLHLTTRVSLDQANLTSTTFLVTTENELNPADNSVVVRHRIVDPSTKGEIAGLLYGDRNDNGVPDPGEELAGVDAHLRPPCCEPEIKGRTDSAGRFSFPGLPAGAYSLDFRNLPGGWVFETAEKVLVDGSPRSTKVAARALRPETDVLSVSMSFTKKTYRVGEQAQVRLTLTNRGRRTLTDLEAGCNRSGEGPHIGGGPEWNPLPAKLTLRPGETRVLHPSGKVPDSAAKFGYTFAVCDFGRANQPVTGRPEAYTEAKAHAEKASTWGHVYHDKNGNGDRDEGEGLARTKIGLTDRDTGRLVATATTDGNGRIEYTGVPAGRYNMHIFGPWVVESISSEHVTVVAPPYNGSGWVAKVKPGAQQPDPAPAENPADPADPAPPANKKLASTGADVTELSLLAVLVLAAGTALVYGTRRRRRTR